MKPYFLLLAVSLFIPRISFAQNAPIMFDYTAVNPSGPGNCDGSITINNIPNGTPPYVFNWYDYANGTCVPASITSFSNLCAGNYAFEMFDANCQHAWINVTLETNSGAPYANTFTNMQFTGESSPGACDGIMSVEVSDSIANSWMDASDQIIGIYYYSNYITSNPTVVNSLCFNDSLGLYISVYDSLFPPYASYGSLNLNSIEMYTGEYCGEMTVWAETVPATDTNTCDGSASTFVWGGVAPFTYDYSSGGTASTENNLCAGFYNVLVTDANGDTASTHFAVSDSTHLYQMYMWGNPSDTLYTNALMNCDLDYTQPIDSAYLDSVYYSNVYDVTVVCVIVQDTNEFIFTETYHLDTTGNFVLSMSYYCQNRSVDNVYTIMAWFPMADMMPLSVPSPNVPPAKKINIAAYPNPFSDIVYCEFHSSKNEQLIMEVRDISGRLVHTEQRTSVTGKNRIPVQLSHTDHGIYLLTITSENGVSGSVKIIKD